MKRYVTVTASDGSLLATLDLKSDEYAARKGILVSLSDDPPELIDHSDGTVSMYTIDKLTS